MSRSNMLGKLNEQQQNNIIEFKFKVNPILDYNVFGFERDIEKENFQFNN